MKYTKRLGPYQRKQLSDSVRAHRRLAFKKPGLSYSIFRDLKDVDKLLGLNLENLIQKRFLSNPRQRVIRFLDSGAGTLRVSAGLKQLFGKKLEITAVSLIHPNTSLKTKRRVLKEIRQNAQKIGVA
ncbi:MAG: hypothetical protein NTY48_02940 [Candidatus Diapherotrites archaeon]|nr:hypothetical protein [Candidatus Diapherotrites archaeon]